MGSQFASQNGLSSAVLQPEFGKSFDYGFVYDPEWIPGLSVNADYYRILLNNLIVSGPGTAQTILTQCFNTQGPICGNVFRSTDGSIKFVVESAFNSGNLVDQGLDVGAHYRLPTTRGATSASAWMAATSRSTTSIRAVSSSIWPATSTRRSATSRVCVAWEPSIGTWVRGRRTGPRVTSAASRWVMRMPGLGPSGVESSTNPYNPNPQGPVLHYGAVTYHNASLGYNIEPINTFVQVGVDNIFDKQPPLLY